MRDRLLEVTAAFDRVLSEAVEVVGRERLDPIAARVLHLRERLDLAGETVVVALVGPTGSGKSSLLNALAGEPVAPTGGRRPTTDRPLAWIPRHSEPGLVTLLDRLGVAERVGHDGDLALIDLPDFDSLEAQHRLLVEELLTWVDVVVFVLDPEKYRDASVHLRYLRPMSRRSSSLVLVLNQADRLRPADLEAVRKDLEASLAEDGISGSQVIVTAADPRSGPPTGIDMLHERLISVSAPRDAVFRAIAAQLMATARDLAEVLGEMEDLGFGLDWPAARVVAAGEIVDGATHSAERRLAAFVGRLGERAGRVCSRQLQPLIESVGDAVDEATEAVLGTRDAVARSRWRWGLLPLGLAVAASSLWLGMVISRQASLLGPASLSAGVIAILVWALARFRRTETVRIATSRAGDRERLVEAVSTGLDSTLGKRLRQALRQHSLLAALMSELSLSLRSLESTASQ